MPTVGFLHTAAVHVPTFSGLLADAAPEVSSVAVVTASLLTRARERGVDDIGVRDGIAAALDELEEQGASVLVCTCSTIAGTAEALGTTRQVPVIRIDRPMAEAAVATGSRIAVLAALASTLGPTTDLLHEVATASRSPVTVSSRLVEGAWDRFESGDTEAYLDAVAAACADAAPTADVIVLAQASMADARTRLALDIPVLASPELAVTAALAALPRPR